MIAGPPIGDPGREGPILLQLAQADDGPSSPIGRVSAVEGAVFVARAGSGLQALRPGDPVYQQDVVSTGPDGKLTLTFIDETLFVMEQEAAMLLDQVIFDPGSAGSSFITTLVKGLFIFATGEIAGEGEMIVKTPSGTIGIRGTTVGVRIAADGNSIQITNLKNPVTGEVGRFTFENEAGETIFAAENDSLAVRDRFAPHDGLARAEPAAVEALFGGLLRDLGRIQRMQGGDAGEDSEAGVPTLAEVRGDDQPLSSGSSTAARMEAGEEAFSLAALIEGQGRLAADDPLGPLAGASPLLVPFPVPTAGATNSAATILIAGAAYRWTGSAGDGDWQNGRNWDFSSPPLDGARALLGSATDIVTYLEDDPTVQRRLYDLDLSGGVRLVLQDGDLGTSNLFVVSANSDFRVAGGNFGVLGGQGRNDGDLLVDGGTFSVSGGRFINAEDMEVRNGGRLEVLGGLFENHGDLTAQGFLDFGGGHILRNFGVFTPAPGVGTATIDGGFRQGSSGEFLVEMNGAGHDVLVVTGAADLAGRIAVETLPGFSANPGDSFLVLTAAQVNGSFDLTAGLNLTPNLFLNVSYGATSVELIASNPATGGADQIYGTAQDNFLKGLGGNDTIVGLAGDDVLEGGAGVDVLLGGPGSDTVTFSSSPSGAIGNLSATMQLSVAPGHALDGFGSMDQLTGIENLDGSGFDDFLFGGNGANLLDGHAGQDDLTGGGGADLFILRPGDGGAAIAQADLVNDFQNGLDKLGLAGGLAFSDVTIGVDGGGNATLQVAAGGEFLMVLQGIAPTLLDPSDFIVY